MARPDDDARDEDADALSWAGDEEQGRAAPRLGEPKTAQEVATDGSDDEEDAPGSGGRRIATVAFAVPYLALAIGWIFSVQLTPGPTELFSGILWQFGEFLTMLSAPLWFAATLTLTRDHPPRVRIGWLALGTLVLLPWPVILRFLAALQVAGSLCVILVPLAFGILFALALVMPVSDLGALPAVYEAYGIGDAVPWPLLVLSIALPPLLYVAALLLGRGRVPFARALILTVALAASFALYFGIVALVGAIQPPLTF